MTLEIVIDKYFRELLLQHEIYNEIMKVQIENQLYHRRSANILASELIHWAKVNYNNSKILNTCLFPSVGILNCYEFKLKFIMRLKDGENLNYLTLPASIC